MANSMPFALQRVTVEGFARFEQILGQRVIVVNDTHWAQVRPLFYRPLLPFAEFRPGAVKAPWPAFLGGFQHAVAAGETTNSCVNLMMFEDAGTYSLEDLDYNRKRQVKLAAKQFIIRPITDRQEFKEAAYSVYLSFQKRTGYEFGSKRTKRDYFSWWADALYQIPSITILGGYRNGTLEGVNMSLLVEKTVCYAMFFCTDESLRLGLSDLMLHSVREAAAESRAVQEIFAGIYKGGTGLDDFYVLRGCKLLKKPALFHANSWAAFLLKRFRPKQYAQLTGNINTVRGEQKLKSATGRQKPEREARKDLDFA